MRIIEKNRTVFSHLFFSLLASFILLVIMLTVIFYFGIRISLQDWNIQSGRRLQNIILPTVTGIYRQEGELKANTLYSGLSPFLTGNMYVYIFDKDQSPLFFFIRGEIIDINDPDLVLEELEIINNDRRAPRPVINEGSIIGFVSTGSLGFSYSFANKKFLKGILLALLLGIGIALTISVAFSYIFSRLISKNTKLLAEGISGLSSGRREFVFPTRGAKELINIAQAAQTLSDKLQWESTLRKRWAQDISHDLKTPITALTTQFENMIEGVSEVTKEKISSLFGEIQKVDKLINDLLQLMKMETPEMKIKINRINVAYFIKEIENSFSHVIKEKGVELKKELLTTEIMGDEKLLSRALSNIMQNACQHVVYEGKLKLRVFKRGTSIILRVLNTGKVAEDEIPRLFERMYRGENSRSTRGSGLGLTIASAICRLHGGKVCMKQEGDSTVVEIVIPEYPEIDNQNHI